MELAGDDRQQLERVVALVREVLGPEVVGAYLFGSAVLGGLRSASDLDVLVVLRRRTTRDEKQRLVERLLEISGRPMDGGRWRRVELTIVVESEIKPWRFPPRLDFEYGDGLRGEFEQGNLEPSERGPDLAILITMVLLAGTPLIGPPPAEVFDPPPEDLARAMVEEIPALLDDLEWDTGNVILTLARIWCTLATGAIRPKDAAADWVLSRLPEEHRPVLERARAVYLGEEPEQWDDLRPGVRPCVDYLAVEIGRLGGAR